MPAIVGEPKGKKRAVAVGSTAHRIEPVLNECSTWELRGCHISRKGVKLKSTPAHPIAPGPGRKTCRISLGPAWTPCQFISPWPSACTVNLVEQASLSKPLGSAALIVRHQPRAKPKVQQFVNLMELFFGPVFKVVFNRSAGQGSEGLFYIYAYVHTLKGTKQPLIDSFTLDPLK